jgi:hypothetical protein
MPSISRNVSNEVVSIARVMVHVGFGFQNGVGSGSHGRRPLQPGEETRIEWKPGPGRGRSPLMNADVSIVAFVDEVRTASCTYRPSQAWWYDSAHRRAVIGESLRGQSP